MKREELNENPQGWFDHAEGFREAYILVYNDWDVWSRRVNFNYKLLLVPQTFLFIHSAELYLKAFLIKRGENWTELKRTHNLKDLRKRCIQHDKWFNNVKLDELDHCAGTAENYAGMKYPEGGIISSPFEYLSILEALHKHIKSEFIQNNH